MDGILHTGSRERQVFVMTTGEKIAALRREHGLSQEALGEQLGLSRQAVSKWEADQAVPTMDNLMELSRLFGVPVDTLLRPEEELPGKGQEPPEGVKISAEGLKVSYAPVLTKKTKWFIIALAALVLVSVLGNLYAMIRVQGMRAQMENLTLRMEMLSKQIGDAGLAYIPQEGQTEEDALSDYDIAYDLRDDPNKTVKTMLALSFSARPKDLDPDGEIAKFTVLSAADSWSCSAILQQDNAYYGNTEIPMRDGFTVYLTLTDRESGAVRNLPLETLSGISNEFRLQLNYEWLDAQGEGLWDGSTIVSEDGSTTISGRLRYRIYNASADELRCYPEKCRLVLRQGDTELKSMELGSVEYNEENGQYYAYGEVDWKVDKPFGELELVAEMTDNYGRVEERNIDDYALGKSVP